MTENKYELRSSDVEEVLNSSPHPLITWGSSIMFFVIVGGLLLSSLINFPNKIKVTFQLNLSQNNALLLTNSPLPSNLTTKLPIKIFFESYNADKYNAINSIIDSISILPNKNFAIHTHLPKFIVNSKSENIIIQNNQIGTLEIINGTKTIIDMLFDR